MANYNLEMSDQVLAPAIEHIIWLTAIRHPLPVRPSDGRGYMHATNHVISRALKIITGAKSISGACADMLLSSAAMYRSAKGILRVSSHTGIITACLPAPSNRHVLQPTASQVY